MLDSTPQARTPQKKSALRQPHGGDFKLLGHLQAVRLVVQLAELLLSDSIDTMGPKPRFNTCFHRKRPGFGSKTGVRQLVGSTNRLEIGDVQGLRPPSDSAASSQLVGESQGSPKDHLSRSDTHLSTLLTPFWTEKPHFLHENASKTL